MTTPASRVTAEKTASRVSDERLAELANMSLGLRIASGDELISILTEIQSLRALDSGSEQQLAACPAPNIGSDTYYVSGKDAAWFEALSDVDAARELTKAAMDLNDSGLGDDLDKWLPFQAMMSDAAGRIERLRTLSSDSVSDGSKGVRK